MQYFYMTVGIPGSGKTHYVSGMQDVSIHSSDSIREEILGNVNDQSNQRLVFDTLHKRVLSDLSSGKNVVFDATNISSKRRVAFLSEVRSLGICDLKMECLFMATPYEKCCENNATRKRVVPQEVVDRMYHNIDIPMYYEGWHKIHILNSVQMPLIDLLKSLSVIKHDNPHHALTIGQHLLAAYSRLKSDYPDSPDILSYATLLHDIGKPDTKVFHDSHGNPSLVAHYYGHDRVGAYKSFQYTSVFPDDERLKIALLIRWHMYPFAIEKSERPEKTRDKLIRKIGFELFNQLMILHQCDLAAH